MERCKITGKVIPIQVSPGQKFGLWTVIQYVGKHKSSNNTWMCTCECGTKSIIPAYRLVSGGSKACQFGGHMKGVNVKHGMKHSKIYRIYQNMKARCYRQKTRSYPLYGGRGISVCDEWRYSFEIFYQDMKEGYTDGLSIERIDVNGNYCKENCRWVAMEDQSKNKRNTAYITYKGVTKRAFDWAEIIGANPKSLSRRVYLGWPPEECLFGKQYEKIKKLILAEELLEHVL